MAKQISLQQRVYTGPNGIGLVPTGETVTINGRRSHVFEESLPAPDWVRVHYYPSDEFRAGEDGLIESSPIGNDLRYVPERPNEIVIAAMKRQFERITGVKK